MTTVSHKELFEKQGYVILKGLYGTEETRKLKEEAAAILARHDVHQSGVFLGLAAESPLFKEAARTPRLTRALQEIFGDSVVFIERQAGLQKRQHRFRIAMAPGLFVLARQPQALGLDRARRRRSGERLFKDCPRIALVDRQP